MGQAEQIQLLRLCVMDGNEAVERLDQRCGFVSTGVLSDVVTDGVDHDDVMEKMLG
jgi:RimJ/RimL family protein N-acetyltransferase